MTGCQERAFNVLPSMTLEDLVPPDHVYLHVERTNSPSVRAIFGAEIHADSSGSWGRNVQVGIGTRSIGGARARDVSAVCYHRYPITHHPITPAPVTRHPSPTIAAMISSGGGAPCW